MAPQQADAEALAEVYRQGVDSAAASPGLTEYFRDTILYGVFRFFEWLERVSAHFAWLNWSLVQVVLTGMLLVLVGWFLFLLLRRILSRPRREPGDGRLVVEAPRRPSSVSRDWAATLQACLQRGDVAGALEALWWWLATQVGVPDADPSWTSRELLGHAGRSDLRRPVRRLDHMIYGPEPPDAEHVGKFWRDLRPRVASGSSSPPPQDSPPSERGDAR